MRAVIYARVSTEEQTGPDHYSIDAQRHACRQYCLAHGWDIAAEYVDEGKSARSKDTSKRPQFQSLMLAAESRQFDCVVVHKLDRFARNLRVLLESLERLGLAGVSFVSLTEQVDYSTASGKLFLTMLGGLAQWGSDNLSHETIKGKTERKRQGKYNGVLPFGYCKAENGQIVPHATNAAGVVTAYDAAARGETDLSIAQLLNQRGYRTTGNHGQNPWRKDSVRRMLLTRFYLGELPANEKRLAKNGTGRHKYHVVGWTEGNHPLLITAEQWEAAQTARAHNRKNQRSLCVAPGRRVYSLTGLLQCGYCLEAGRRATIQIALNHGRARCTCYSRDEGLDCPQMSAAVEVYEEQVEQWLECIAITDKLLATALAGLDKRTGGVPDVAAERSRLQSRLDRLGERYDWGDIARERYLAERDNIRAELGKLRPVEQKRLDLEAVAEYLRQVPALWLSGTPDERNRIATTVIERIVVKDNRVEAIVPRPDCSVLLP